MSPAVSSLYRFFFIPDRTIAAAVAIAGLLLITGVHHFDGLLDLGTVSWLMEIVKKGSGH